MIKLEPVRNANIYIMLKTMRCTQRYMMILKEYIYSVTTNPCIKTYFIVMLYISVINKEKDTIKPPKQSSRLRSIPIPI
jgi:hypothetical protein